MMLSLLRSKKARGRPRVFVVGLPKTGTTSLNRALRMLGYLCCPYIGYEPVALDLLERRQANHPPNAEQEQFLRRQIDRYTAFEDTPWWAVYPFLDGLAPDSRFILTLRKSPETWLRSLQAQETKAEKTATYAYRKRVTYGWEQIEGHAEEHLALYTEHLDKVRNFFGDRLLEVCWESGHGWTELCDYLQLPPPDKPFPHKNRSAR